MGGIPWLSIESSVLAALAYRRRTLWVRFHGGGGIYRYRGVPDPVWQQLLAAESAGAYFNQHIRNNFPSDHFQQFQPRSSVSKTK